MATVAPPYQPAYRQQPIVASNRLQTAQAVNPAQADAMVIQEALNRVGQIRNLPQYESYLLHLGVYPPFRGGADALRLIQQRGAQVIFGDMGDTTAHAQWISEENKMMINQKYRGNMKPETLCAIAAAIYHEAGHAAGNGDGQSSIQEEINCLGLNTLAHLYFCQVDPAYNYASGNSQNPLLANGVALYPKLFFDPDPLKRALVNRVVEKYGDLPMTSPGHPVPPATMRPLPLVYRVAEAVDNRNVQAGAISPSPALGHTIGNPWSTTQAVSYTQAPVYQTPLMSYSQVPSFSLQQPALSQTQLPAYQAPTLTAPPQFQWAA